MSLPAITFGPDTDTDSLANVLGRLKDLTLEINGRAVLVAATSSSVLVGVAHDDGKFVSIPIETIESVVYV